MMFRQAIPVVYTFWCGVGFVRGVKQYKYEKKDLYLYSNFISMGFYGTLFYANPAFFPFTLYKEMYRLEVNLRNLENEKKSDYYNTVI